MPVRILSWAVLVGLATSSTNGAEPLRSRVEGVIKTKGYQDGHWGCLVVDAKTGEPSTRRCRSVVLPCVGDQVVQYRGGAGRTRRGPPVPDAGGPQGRGRQGRRSRGGPDPRRSRRPQPRRADRPRRTSLFVDDDHTYADGNLEERVVAADPWGTRPLAREVAAAGIKSVTATSRRRSPV